MSPETLAIIERARAAIEDSRKTIAEMQRIAEETQIPWRCPGKPVLTLEDPKDDTYGEAPA